MTVLQPGLRTPVVRVRATTSSTEGRVPGPVIAGVVGVGYFALAQYVIWLNDPVRAGAGYWPAAGLTLAALVVLPARRWGWVLGAVVVAEIGGGALQDYPLEATSWWAAANVAVPLVAALLLRRFGHGGRLAPVGDLLWFLLAGVVVGPFVGAAIGSVGTSSAFGTDQVDVLLKWWAGDGLGVLVVSPLLLCFRERPATRRAPVEAAALAVTTLVVSVLVFRNWHPVWDVVTPYAVFPLLAWAGIRFGIRGAAITGFAVAEAANLATALHYGPFHLVAGPTGHAITALQLYLTVAVGAGLLIATLVHDTVARTRLYERQRSVADALQEAVLPDRLPTVPGLTFAARYLPASSDAAVHVGGDWYDAFELPNGRTAFVVGDVAGHDLAAAVVMGHLRNGLRSLLIELDDPAQVMAALDRQLTTSDDAALATVIIAVVDDGEIRWVNAGHPPLLLAPAEGPAGYLDGGPDPMIGIGIGQGHYVSRVAPLRPGDLVVGFTDGLVEHRTWSLDEGFAHLVRLVDTTPTRDPERVCDLLLAEGLGGRHPEDDACILAVRCGDGVGIRPS